MLKPWLILSTLHPLPRSVPWFLLKALIRLQFPRVKQISTATLATWLADPTRPNPLLLDVRTAEEYAVSHLQHAQRVEPQRPTPFDSSLLNPETPIVTYCSVGYRSAALCDQLQCAGFTCVANLEGSIFQWANEGRPLYPLDRGVLQVHPYDALWGKLLRPELRQPLLQQSSG